MTLLLYNYKLPAAIHFLYLHCEQLALFSEVIRQFFFGHSVKPDFLIDFSARLYIIQKTNEVLKPFS